MVTHSTTKPYGTVPSISAETAITLWTMVEILVNHKWHNVGPMSIKGQLDGEGNLSADLKANLLTFLRDRQQDSGMFKVGEATFQYLVGYGAPSEIRRWNP